MPKWYDETDDDMDMDMEMGMMDYMDEEEDRMEPGGMPKCVILAHAYVPWQCYDKAYCPEEALMKGTLFPELWGVYPIPE